MLKCLRDPCDAEHFAESMPVETPCQAPANFHLTMTIRERPPCRQYGGISDDITHRQQTADSM